jgi:hypothetical protein
VEIVTHSSNWLDQRYDFGDDGPEAALAADPAFDAWLRSTAPALHVPGVAPADAMWSAIEAAQRTSREASAGRVGGVTPLRRPWMMPAVIAATLLLGVGLDRVLLSRSGARSAAPSASAGARVAVRAPAGDSEARAGLYRLAAVQTLSQAEALLTAYRAGGPTQRPDDATRQLGAWAREVLGSTRLLIDSPAGADAQLRPLLNDIELVLVQIVRLSGSPLDSADRALIDRALRDRDLLPRLRTAVPAGATDATIASDD